MLIVWLIVVRSVVVRRLVICRSVVWLRIHGPCILSVNSQVRVEIVPRPTSTSCKTVIRDRPERLLSHVRVDRLVVGSESDVRVLDVNLDGFGASVRTEYVAVVEHNVCRREFPGLSADLLLNGSRISTRERKTGQDVIRPGSADG